MCICKSYEKYIFLVNNTAVTIEAEDKLSAIEIFKEKFSTLFLMDWSIKRVNTEITIDGETNLY